MTRRLQDAIQWKLAVLHTVTHAIYRELCVCMCMYMSPLTFEHCFRFAIPAEAFGAQRLRGQTVHQIICFPFLVCVDPPSYRKSICFSFSLNFPGCETRKIRKKWRRPASRRASNSATVSSYACFKFWSSFRFFFVWATRVQKINLLTFCLNFSGCEIRNLRNIWRRPASRRASNSANVWSYVCFKFWLNLFGKGMYSCGRHRY